MRCSDTSVCCSVDLKNKRSSSVIEQDNDHIRPLKLDFKTGVLRIVEVHIQFGSSGGELKKIYEIIVRIERD